MQSWYHIIKHVIRVNDTENFLQMYGHSLEVLFLRPGHARETKARQQLRGTNSMKILGREELDAENEKELLSCSKSAYISPTSLIDIEVAFFAKNYPWKKFTTGSEPMHPVYMWGWSFPGGDSSRSKIPRYFSLMIDSGIYLRLEKEMAARFSRGRKPVSDKEEEATVQMVSLNGGMITLFILCGSWLLLAGLELMVECRRAIMDGIVTFYRSIKLFYRYLWWGFNKFCARIFRTKKARRKKKGRRKIHVKVHCKL
jgi:hypothetical protein